MKPPLNLPLMRFARGRKILLERPSCSFRQSRMDGRDAHTMQGPLSRE